MTTSDSLVSGLLEVAVDSCWRQWSALGAPLVSSRTGAAQAIVDGEALLLTTAFVAQHERRLVDVMVNAAATGAPLLSVKRLASLVEHYPQESTTGLGPFGEAAVTAGDRRWKPFIGSSNQPARVGFEERTWTWTAALRRPTGLMLRLRAGFGHGTKADALTYLLGRAGTLSTAAEVAEATQATTTAVRVALRDMVLAGFVRENRGHPNRYGVTPGAWKSLLGDVGGDPGGAWRNWAGVFSYVCGLISRIEEVSSESDYVVASAARDVYEHHRNALEVQQLLLPSPELHPGPRYLAALEQDLPTVRRWFARML